MISKDELINTSKQHGVPLPNVEKDYVMGWLLWGIAQNQYLANNLILKGGNCLRKIYFADTRFSDDLDFTARNLDTDSVFREYLRELCSLVGTASGIEFDLERIQVEAKQRVDQSAPNLDGRVYFRGFAGDSNVTMRIKFDVSDFEKIVLPLQWHPIIHPYTDRASIDATIQTYSLEEILAEKLRSWIQRTRARDLFDIARILSSSAIPISRPNIASAFFQKTLFKDVPFGGKEEMLFQPKFDTVSSHWLQTILCPATSMIIAANAITLFRDFVDALLDADLLAQLGVNRQSGARYPYDVRSGVRETIIEAGKARNMLRLDYHGVQRTVEPYSFRFRWTKKGYGAEYFYGYDRTRGNTIKSFFLHEVQRVSILPSQYVPRWVVEF